MRKLELKEALLSVMVFGYGLFTFNRGFFWTISSDKVINDSDFYMKLHEIMPIQVWGFLLMVVSLKLMLAAWFIPSEKLNNVCHWLLTFGGMGACFMYFLMTAASIHNAINWLTWSQFAILTAKSGAIAVVGGVGIYDRRAKRVKR